jgi:hypothetical protein
VCTDAIPEVYGFLAGIERFRTDPDPDADYDLLVISDCGTLDRVGAVAYATPSSSNGCRGSSSTTTASNDDARRPADWVDPGAAATCEMATLFAVRLGVPLDTGDGSLAAALMAGIVMDTATFAHPNATPRTLVVSAALVEAGAPLSDISRRLYRSKPERPAQAVRPCPRPARDERGRPDRVVHARGRRPRGHGQHPVRFGGIIDLLAQAETAEVAILFKQAPGGTRLSVRTKPGGVDATVSRAVRRRRPRPGRRGDDRAPPDEARPVVLAEAARLAAAVSR